MKRNILIGCGVLTLFFIIWFGARNLDASAKKAVSSDNAESVDTESDSTKKRLSLQHGTNDSEEQESGNTAENAASAETIQGEESTAEKTAKETVDTSGETSTSSDGNTLYTIKTSAGSNLGMVPIVNGNAVVLMDGSYASIYQGDYTPEERDAFSLKMENETAKALSNSKIAEWAFYREAMLYDFTFPDGVTEIEKFAFARSSLGRITIPEGVTRIGYGAFYHCDALTEVTIPDSVTVIEENAFSHTPWLDSWLAGGEAPAEGDETAEESAVSNADDFLIVGDGILLAYRGSEAKPELPEEVKSVVPGVFEE